MSDVAIVMAAYNEERHIERALRSCVAQSIPCEVIVVDDGSTDRTWQLAKSFGVNVLDRKHHGLPSALNVGIRNAQSRYVARVDADDYVHRDFAKILAMHLDMNEDMEAVACDYLTVDGHERHLEHVSAAYRPIGCGIMFRKDRLVEIGLYNEGFLIGEDAELRSRWPWPVHNCRLPLYRYRRHPGSMTLKAAA